MSSSKTHDYTHRGWGHDFVIRDVIDGGYTLKLMGWGRGIQEGDFLILPNNSDTTRYRVQEIVYFSDPSDMWKMTAIFDSR